ncbi:MAG: serine/threonine-protein kinase [Planctomycetota bacterium]|jgi:serine/threonine-protein kinase
MTSPLRRLRRSEPEWPTIPGYRLESVIGRGSTGIVYRAVQTAVDREVAVKVLLPELVAKPRIVERLRREARTLARLRHPHLISAIDMGEQDGRWWFAMEFVDGPSLADRIRSEGPLTEREALRLFLPLAEALGALWEGGVVHRDIKPGNVLLERGPRGGVVRARLADLGLAFAGDEPGLTGQGGTLGTPHYISPEQARDPSGVDIRTDIWSFGATLFHALCGRPPFTGESMAEVLSAVLHARIPDPQRLAPHLGRGMALVVRRCLTRDPAGRYQDPPELLADLELLRERRAPAVVPTQLDPLDGQNVLVRHKWTVAASLVALASGMTVVGLDSLGPDPTLPLTARERSSAPLLERLVGQVEKRPARLAGAWIELEGLRDEAPGDLLWLQVRAELLERLETVVGDALAARANEVDTAIEAADFTRARVLTSEASLAELVRNETGFELAELPKEASRQLDGWRRERSVRVEGALRSTVAAFADGVGQHRDDFFLPELERLRERGSWRSAFELLGASGAELVRRAGLDPARLPEAELDEATVETRVRLDVELVALERAWRAEERSLGTWIAGEVDARLRRVDAMPLGAVVESDLEPVFEAELTRRGTSWNELPAIAVSEFRQRLVEAERELDLGIAKHTVRCARQAFELRARTLAPALMERREYEAAVALWDSLIDELRAIDGLPSELLEEASVERDAASRLESVLRRAADAVRAERGRTREIRVGNIRVVGRLDSGRDPLADGFFLRPESGEPYRLDLRRLARADLEALAGLDSAASELDPDERLALGRLALAEGDVAEAQRVVGSGGLPPGPSSDALIAAINTPRRAAADGVGLLEELDHPAIGGGARLSVVDPAAAAVVIEILLAQHLDEPAVALRSNVLRRELLQLERGRGDGSAASEALTRDHPGASVEVLDVARARITFEAGTLDRFVTTSGGDLSGDERSVFELLLSPMLDIGAGPWSLELQIPTGSIGDLDLSIGGYRLVRVPVDAGWNWWVGTSGETPFAAETPVRTDRTTTDPVGFETVRLEFDRPHADVRLYVDGRFVLRARRAPASEAVESRLAVTSSGDLSVRRLVLEGPLR